MRNIARPGHEKAWTRFENLVGQPVQCRHAPSRMRLSFRQTNTCLRSSVGDTNSALFNIFGYLSHTNQSSVASNLYFSV